MKRFYPSETDGSNRATRHISTGNRDLVVRIADWTDDPDEAAYDVEMYVGGVYVSSESAVFSVDEDSKDDAKTRAIAFAQKQIAALL